MTPEERRKFIAENIGTKPEDFSPEDLRAIANGPIMDSNAIYLPAGRLTMDEYREREARILRGEQPLAAKGAGR